MQFQRFLDPFGTALQQQGKQLENEGQQLTNAINLYKLGQTKAQYEAMLEDMDAAKKGADELGYSPSSTPTLKEQGDPNSKQQSPIGGMSAGAPLGSGMLYQQSQQAAAMARKYRYLNPSLSEKYLSRSESLINNAVVQADKEAAQKDKFLGHLEDFAAASTDPEAMGRQLALLQGRAPQGVNLDKLLYTPVEKGGLGLKQGPNGLPIYDPEAFKQIGQFSHVAREQARMAHEATIEQMRADGAARADRSLEDRERSEARREARQRDSDRERDRREAFGKLPNGYRWVDANDPSKGMERIPVTGDPKVTDKAQSELEKQPEWKNWDRYEQAHMAAVAVENKMRQPQGYQNVTAADVQRLRQHYTQVIADFKSRAGTKYDQEQVNKLNGVLQKMDKWVTTIGRGTPALAEGPAKDVMFAINDEYASRMQGMVKDQLRVAKRVESQGGNPNRLRLKGDVPWLVSRGYAVVKPDSDDPTRKWLYFKEDKDHPVPYYEEAFE